MKKAEFGRNKTTFLNRSFETEENDFKFQNVYKTGTEQNFVESCNIFARFDRFGAPKVSSDSPKGRQSESEKKPRTNLRDSAFFKESQF